MMNKNENIRIARMHISSLEKSDNEIYKLNISKYPDRICVVDEEREIVVDVETSHQYPYIKTKSMLYFVDMVKVKQLEVGQRIGCMEYAMLPFLELDSNTLDLCNNIMVQLKNGKTFLDGNKELTNEEYLEIVNKQKEIEKTKKFGKKRK